MIRTPVLYNDESFIDTKGNSLYIGQRGIELREYHKCHAYPTCRISK